jgi:hypothetical protein
LAGKLAASQRPAALPDMPIRSCVSRGLSIIGEKEGRTILWLLESRYGLDLEAIEADPARFVLALREVFGLGAVGLLMSILRELRLVDADDEKTRKALDRFAAVIEDGHKSVESGVV